MGKVKDSVDYKRAYYNEFCGLLSRRTWLLHKSEELEELLEKNNKDNERYLLFDLLEYLTVTEQDSIDRFLHDMAVYIKDNAATGKHAVICAFTRGREPDSGQVIIQLLKPALDREGVEHYSLCNTLDKLSKELKNYPETDRIIIVDETVGSGVTLENQLNYIRQLNGCSGIPVFVCVIAAIRSSVETVLSHHDGVGLFCPIMLYKGISERYDGEKKESAIETMRAMEERLAPRIGDKELKTFSFGYGRAEMLYAHETWNAPNSLFPIFWWPKDKNGNKRNALFTRSL